MGYYDPNLDAYVEGPASPDPMAGGASADSMGGGFATLGIFQRDVLTAMLDSGIDIGQLDPTTLTALYQQLADNPDVARSWTELGRTSPSDMVKYLKQELFDQKTSTDPTLLQLGMTIAGQAGPSSLTSIYESQARADIQARAAYGISEEGYARQTLYDKAVTLWEQYFGRRPTDAEFNSVVNSGKDLQQWTNYVRSLPSHIAGMNMGLYTDGRALVDSESNRVFGHAGTDGIVKQLHDQNLLDPGGAKLFYDQMGATKATAPAS